MNDQGGSEIRPAKAAPIIVTAHSAQPTTPCATRRERECAACSIGVPGVAVGSSVASVAAHARIRSGLRQSPLPLFAMALAGKPVALRSETSAEGHMALRADSFGEHGDLTRGRDVDAVRRIVERAT